MPHLDSVNLARPQLNPYKETRATGIGKTPVAGPVEVRPPGPKTTGLGSGLVGDYIGDGKHHGGDTQAVYAFQREDLDRWAARLDRELPNGFFGENLTTVGMEANEALVGERWRVSDPTGERSPVELEVTAPRIPCSTFRGWMNERAWLKTFTIDARSGTYLRVVTPGLIAAGDRLEVSFRPSHQVSIALVFRAITRERELLPELLAAADYLEPETLELVRRSETVLLD